MNLRVVFVNFVARFLILLCLIVSPLAVNSLAGGDVVDLSFDPNLSTANYLNKYVAMIVPQPDGKILVGGSFNKYNGENVGALIRLNSDGTLDETFNKNVCAVGSPPWQIRLQSDGKFLLQGVFELGDGTQISGGIVRIDENGNIDPTFVYDTPGSIFNDIEFDQTGRVLLPGFFQVDVNGTVEDRTVIRLNSDGSIDDTYVATEFVSIIGAQGNKMIYVTDDIPLQQQRMFRFNEDGSVDSTFNSTLLGNSLLRDIIAQPDGKLVVLTGSRLIRVNVDGGIDSTFTEVSFPSQPDRMFLGDDGRITVAYRINGSAPSIIKRILSDGSPDTSFTEYNTGFGPGIAKAMNADNSLYVGDANSNGTNQFVKLDSNGSVDSTYNSGGTGFQFVLPGRIRAIEVLSDDKIMIGGNFDRVNGATRFNIARLNPDSTLDTSFELQTGTGDNQFSQLLDIYGITALANGKFLVNGGFTYKVNGASKANLVRLNSDGSIDSGFSLGLFLNDTFGISNLSQNHMVTDASNNIYVGTTRASSVETLRVPTALTESGTVISSFDENLYPKANLLAAFAVAVQPNGKILISGRYVVGDINGSVRTSYIARLNSDGSKDLTFDAAETENEEIYAFSLLPDGKILMVRRSDVGSASELVLLNSDGSVDSSFDSGTGADGKINVVVPYTKDRFVIGGLFDNYNGQPRSNFAVVNSDGSLNALSLEVNSEIHAIEVDNQNRILIGGDFTAIQSGGQIVERSYVARLAAEIEVARTFLDFDGDGRTDISVFRTDSAEWFYRNSSDGVAPGFQFGNSGDRPAPADFTGDGKADIAFFRPTTGEWFVIRSDNTGFYSFPFGADGDIPAPGDFDGDGTDDAAVYRPTEGMWYMLLSSGGTMQIRFGTNGDQPVVADYDGDGKDDVAIYRPDVSQWWILRSTAGLAAYQFGAVGDIPARGDFTGDGKADVAQWRPSTGRWFVLQSEDNQYFSAPFGQPGDIPTPGDYDGDGKTDFAVFRVGDLNWYLSGSTSGLQVLRFGLANDSPLPAYYQR